MMELIFITTNILFCILSFLSVIIWKKKNFVKELYIEKGASIVFYFIAIAAALLPLIFYLIQSYEYPWNAKCALLLLITVMLLMFMYDSTNCIYLQENMLYHKNIFRSKQILIDDQTRIIEKRSADKIIIESGKSSISIPLRGLTGDLNTLVYKIKTIIDQ